MFKQKSWLVVLITPNSLQLHRQGQSEIETILLPASIVGNLEIINKDALYTLITDWTKQSTYTNTGVIWLLSPDVCFDHVVSSSEQDKVDSETLQFLDTVPFEEVLSRLYNTSEGRTITAVNKTLIMAYIQGFSLHGYNTKIVVPFHLLSTESNLTIDLAQLAVKRATELAKESLIVEPQEQNPVLSTTIVAPGSSTPKAKPKSSLPLLLSVFAVLLAILGFVLYLNQ